MFSALYVLIVYNVSGLRCVITAAQWSAGIPSGHCCVTSSEYLRPAGAPCCQDCRHRARLFSRHHAAAPRAFRLRPCARPRQWPHRFDRHVGRECAGLDRAAHRNYRGSYEGEFIIPDMGQEYLLSEGLSMA